MPFWRLMFLGSRKFRDALNESNDNTVDVFDAYTDAGNAAPVFSPVRGLIPGIVRILKSPGGVPSGEPDG